MKKYSKQIINRIKTNGIESIADIELTSFMSGLDINTIQTLIESSEKGLRSVYNMTINDICEKTGITEYQACKIKTSLELGKRLSSKQFVEKQRITSPDDAVAYVMTSMRDLQFEEPRVILLNAKNQVIGTNQVSSGNINSAIVDASVVFKSAIQNAATSVLLFHNHPSGDPVMSEADVRVTEQIMKAGEIIGIPLADHIVIGDGIYTSYKRGHEKINIYNHSVFESHDNNEYNTGITYESSPEKPISIVETSKKQGIDIEI